MIVREIECGSVDEFIAEITLIGSITKKITNDFLLFRGVANGYGENEHTLVPSALRLENFDRLGRLAGYGRIPEDSKQEFAEGEWTQGRHELEVLGHFFRHADMQGLPLPENTVIRQLLQFSHSSSAPFFQVMQKGGVWPQDELLPLFGLAQHYGLPTRLLDWSRDGRTAAYFATIGALERVRKEENTSASENKLAVWIFNAGLIQLQQRKLKKGIEAHYNIPLTVFTPPTAGNPNLQAQQGVFSVWRPRFVELQRQKVDRRPLDELLEEVLKREGVEFRTPIFHKITLQISQARELLKYLFRVGVTASKLIPGYGGAAQAVNEWPSGQNMDDWVPN